MSGTGGNDELISELRRRLIGEKLSDGVNPMVRAPGGVVHLHLMAVDLGRLGMLLATLPGAAELPEPWQRVEPSCPPGAMMALTAGRLSSY